MLAVVHGKTFAIDSWHDVPPHETMDKAFFEGHYYSDKVFGVSLLALPLAYALNATGGVMPFMLVDYLLRMFAVSLPAAIAVVLLYLLIARLGVPPRRAVLLAAGSFFGTMWFGYSTIFFPYAPGIACVLGALYLTLYPVRGRLEQRECAAIGFLLGYALLCDLVFNIAVAGVGVVWLCRMLDQGGIVGMRSFAEMRGETTQPKRLARLALVFAVFAMLPMALFAAYCYSIFGTFSLPYQFEVNDEFREGMARGIMGVTMPKPDVMFYLTLHPYRGIFIWSPMVALALAGCVIGTRQYGRRKMLGWLGLAMFVGYLLFNAGYYMWWGGWGMGPRFLLPMLPLTLIGLSEFAFTPSERKGATSTWPERHGFKAAVVFILLSFFANIPLSLSDPQTPTPRPTPVPAGVAATPYYIRFYTARTTMWIGDRMLGQVFTNDRASAALSMLFVVGIPIGLLGLAWRATPAKTLYPRIGYPLKTVDGSIRPQAT